MKEYLYEKRRQRELCVFTEAFPTIAGLSL